MYVRGVPSAETDGRGVIGFLVTFLALTVAHLALRCREQARVVRRQSKIIAARDEKIVMLHRNILLISGKWASEKQETARLREKLEPQIPTDADIEAWVKAGRS